MSSNYRCLEYIFMVPKVSEPLKFYCITNCLTGIFSFLYPCGGQRGLKSQNKMDFRVIFRWIFGRFSEVCVFYETTLQQANVLWVVLNIMKQNHIDHTCFTSRCW